MDIKLRLYGIFCVFFVSRFQFFSFSVSASKTSSFIEIDGHGSMGVELEKAETRKSKNAKIGRAKN